MDLMVWLSDSIGLPVVLAAGCLPIFLLLQNIRLIAISFHFFLLFFPLKKTLLRWTPFFYMSCKIATSGLTVNKNWANLTCSGSVNFVIYPPFYVFAFKRFKYTYFTSIECLSTGKVKFSIINKGKENKRSSNNKL